MDYYRPNAIKELLEDVDRVMTMGDMVNNISPPVEQYTVRPGDTLWDIARQYGTTVREIVRLNPQIKDPNLIRPNEKIDIPGKKVETPSPLSAVAPSVPEMGEDAIEGVFPEALLPGMGQLGKLAGMGALKGISALARAAPAALPRAGAIAMPSMSNVRPYGNPGMVKAMLVKMQGMRPLGQGGQMNIPPGPPMNTSLLDALRGQPTLGGLQAVGRGQLQGAGGDIPFQELLRRVGYGQ